MGRHSGGVTVFVKCSLVDMGYIKRDFLDFDDCVVLILKGYLFDRNNGIVLCFPYVPLEGSLFIIKRMVLLVLIFLKILYCRLLQSIQMLVFYWLVILTPGVVIYKIYCMMIMLTIFFIKTPCVKQMIFIGTLKI